MGFSWTETNSIWTATGEVDDQASSLHVQQDPCAEDPMGGVFVWRARVGTHTVHGEAYTPDSARRAAESAAERLGAQFVHRRRWLFATGVSVGIVGLVACMW